MSYLSTDLPSKPLIASKAFWGNVITVAALALTAFHKELPVPVDQDALSGWLAGAGALAGQAISLWGTWTRATVIDGIIKSK